VKNSDAGQLAAIDQTGVDSQLKEEIDHDPPHRRADRLPGRTGFSLPYSSSPSQAPALLVDYLNEVNRLADHPRRYNALTQNCTTTIREYALKAGGEGRLGWRLLANGDVDQLLCERRQISTDLPFTSLRAQSNITERAKAADDSPDFCTRIRLGLPDFNEP